MDAVRESGEEANRKRQWAELSGAYQGEWEGMTLREFQAMEKEDVNALFQEASIPAKERGKFRLLHKGDAL